MWDKGKAVGYSWMAEGRFGPKTSCKWYVWCVHVKTCAHPPVMSPTKGNQRYPVTMSVFSQLSNSVFHNVFQANRMEISQTAL